MENSFGVACSLTSTELIKFIKEIFMDAIEQGILQGGRADATPGSHHSDGQSQQHGGWPGEEEGNNLAEESYYGEVRRLDRGAQHADSRQGAQSDPGARQGGAR